MFTSSGRSRDGLIRNLLVAALCSEVVLLDVVNNERESLGLLTVLDDGNGGSSLHLTGVVLLVVLAVAEPLTEVHLLLNVDEGDTVGLGKSLDELLVLGVIAILGEDAKESLLAVKSLADFVEALNEA